MATPGHTRIGQGSSKSLTGLTVTITGVTLAVGDLVLVGTACDPGSGTVSVTGNAGTATLSSWTAIDDITSTGGSGTTGARMVTAWAKCTGAGTLTSLTITIGTSGDARAVDVLQITGADGTTPIAAFSSVSGGTFTAGSQTGPFNPVGSAGRDECYIQFTACEATSGGTVTWTQPSSWTKTTSDATFTGTASGGSASNMSVAYGSADRTSVPSGNQDGGSLTTGTGTMATTGILIQAPAAGGGGTTYTGWGIPIF